jgi:hypothetical protein
MKTPVTLALAAALLGAALPCATPDRALAQAADPAAHQYVVTVSGMT